MIIRRKCSKTHFHVAISISCGGKVAKRKRLRGGGGGSFLYRGGGGGPFSIFSVQGVCVCSGYMMIRGGGGRITGQRLSWGGEGGGRGLYALSFTGGGG